MLIVIWLLVLYRMGQIYEQLHFSKASKAESYLSAKMLNKLPMTEMQQDLTFFFTFFFLLLDKNKVQFSGGKKQEGKTPDKSLKEIHGLVQVLLSTRIANTLWFSKMIHPFLFIILLRFYCRFSTKGKEYRHINCLHRKFSQHS